MTPKIENYGFGRITINGHSYTEDVKVFPDGIVPEWWREEGHVLQPGDIEDVLDYKPDVLIVGQGKEGRMSIPAETQIAVEYAGILLRSATTDDAVDLFNEATKEAVGVFHLTC
jgi:hypothetical protein